MKKSLAIGAVSVLLLAACGEEEAGNTEQPATEETATEPADEQSEEVTEETDEQNEEPAAEEPAEERTVEYRINEGSWRVEPAGDASEQVALLTFDDAPENYAVDIARQLKEKDVPAIFFVNGHFLDDEEGQGEAMLKEIHEMGFAIGNHTYTHPNLQTISEEEQREEIVSLSDRVEEIIGERPHFFRAPFGANTDFTKQLAVEEDMTLMNWTYGYDWEADYMEAASLADIMVNTELLSPGANLLMHDREWTNGAIGEIVDGLEDKGYRFVDPDTIELPSDL